MKRECDVFISYNCADRDWARGELLSRLEASSLRVCIDFKDFEPGAPTLTEVESAILDCRKTVLVLTPAYLESSRAEFETLLLQTLDPANRERRLIPLLRKPCDLPRRIDCLTPVDFTEPRQEAVAWKQLLTALGAQSVQEESVEPLPRDWYLAHPHAMSPNFTGRVAERQMLKQWLEADPDHALLVLRALGGSGKSALVWHWLMHDVPRMSWSRLVWWSFYENADFEGFLQYTLAHLEIETRNLTPYQQVSKLLQLLRQPGILLILDGFEGALRTYSRLDGPRQNERECVSPIAEHFVRGIASLPGLHGKALMTTRQRPSAVENLGGFLLRGCRELELAQMLPTDAAAFFHAQGIRGNLTEIEHACEPYNYHPLSLRLLSGLILHDPQQPGDIAVARRLEASGVSVWQQRQLVDRWNHLTSACQRLLSRIACFRGPANYPALHALATEDHAANFDDNLWHLLDQGLLQQQAGIYYLDPIVRRYAYGRLAVAERHTVHSLLRSYFATVPVPQQTQRIKDLAPLIELYHHTVQAGLYDEAFRIYCDQLATPLSYHFGDYELQLELLRALCPAGEDSPPFLKEESAQAWVLNAMARNYSLSGKSRQAVPLYDQISSIVERHGDARNLVISLGNLAEAQLKIGMLQPAEVNLRRSITLCREIQDESTEGVGHRELGRLLAYRGAWSEAERELATALEIFQKQKDVRVQAVTWAHSTLCRLLSARATRPASTSLAGREASSDVSAALVAIRRAIELADESARIFGSVERDYARFLWLLGAAHRADSDWDEADRQLTEALIRCQTTNSADLEADILLDIVRLWIATGEREEATRIAQELLVATEHSGHILQGADAHLCLAQMALDVGDKQTALAHARQARRLATCDGPPDYTYKAAYDEAGAFLASLKL